MDYEIFPVNFLLPSEGAMLPARRSSRWRLLGALIGAVVLSALTAQTALGAWWDGPYACAITSSGGHQNCGMIGPQKDRIQHKAKTGSLATPYNWIQTNSSNGTLVWSSGEINNFAWSIIPNYLYGTGIQNRTMTDNRHSGTVTGTYQYASRVP